MLPPAVKDLVDKLDDPREADFTKDNIMSRLVAIETAARSAVKRYKKARDGKAIARAQR